RFDYLYRLISTLLRGTPISTRFPYTTLFRSLFSFCNGRQNSFVGLLVNDRTHIGFWIFSRKDINTLSRCHQALCEAFVHVLKNKDRKSTRLNSSHVKISYAVFCLKKKKNIVK